MENINVCCLFILALQHVFCFYKCCILQLFYCRLLLVFPWCSYPICAACLAHLFSLLLAKSSLFDAKVKNECDCSVRSQIPFGVVGKLNGPEYRFEDAHYDAYNISCCLVHKERKLL